ncbi:hypothetical protein [Winogradskyella haliclonae]|uniref:Uncharacterized protein n=1 Tax=Winogradskyella haliclonae TaxID=2048558 RepID=A0ABQ2C1G3_9FLAO|nr:hypothetical protein [Winogradskyella haliclonae]GGI58209.1 hypothetical protein GCM10011444_25180 [Winogradskyella haliclonae]
MKIKWYLFSFVLSLTLLGVVQQYQKPSANQEIVIHFADEQLTDSQAEDSLVQISNALELIGADSIEITSSDNGFVRISYHSDKAVSNVKQMLSEEAEITFDSESKLPIQKEAKDYILDIFQIEIGDNTPWDFEGQQVYTFNLKSDRSFNPDVLRFPVLVETSKTYFNLKVAYNANQLVVFVSDNTSHNIPEVRAGPLA